MVVAAAILLSGTLTVQAHSEDEYYSDTASHSVAMPIMLVDDSSENVTSPFMAVIAGGSVITTLLAFRLMKKKK